GNFSLGRFQKLLVAAIDQLGNLATDQISGVSENLHAIVPVFLDGGGNVIFSQKNAPLHSRRFDQVESVIAQPAQRVFITSLLYLGCHSSWVSNPFYALLLTFVPLCTCSIRCTIAGKSAFLHPCCKQARSEPESRQPLL